MGLEADAWAKLRPHLVRAKLDPVRVENPIHPGTPDLNLATGDWIELKAIAKWPARHTTVVKIPHFTPQQRVWLYKRWRARAGSTHLALYVHETSEWLLFDGDVAAKIVGRVSAGDHVKGARAVISDRELVRMASMFPSPT